MCEPGKSSPVDIQCERVVIGAEQVDSHVKFLTSQKQRILNILLDNIFVIVIPSFEFFAPFHDLA